MTSKSKMWLQWLLIMILSFQFIGAAIAKLMGQMCEHFMSNGFSYEFMMFIGYLEVLSVVGLLFSKFRVKASLVQMIIMCGAIYTHLPAHQYLMTLVCISNIGFSSIIIWAELEKKYFSDEMLVRQ